MDVAILRAINGLHRPWLDAVARLLGEWGFVLYAGTMLAILWFQKRRAAPSVRDGVLALFATEFLTERVLKQIVARPRPVHVPSLRRVLHVLGRVPSASSYSFPSGASAVAFAGATWLWLRWGPRAGIPGLVVATATMWARMYAGVHYPTDVVAGAVCGVVFAFGVHRLTAWIEANAKRAA